MNYEVIRQVGGSSNREMKDMPIGSIGLWLGHLVLRSYSGWVDLERPDWTWDNPVGKLENLPAGMEIILRIK
jgi:hypothetical protein